MWTIFKVFIEFVIILFLFHVLVFWPGGMWDLNSQPGIKLTPPVLEGKVLTTGQLGKPPVCLFLDLNKHRNSVKRYTPNW